MSGPYPLSQSYLEMQLRRRAGRAPQPKTKAVPTGGGGSTLH